MPSLPSNRGGTAIDSMIQALLETSKFDNRQESASPVAPISPKEHKLSKAPDELWCKVLDYVDVQDVMSLRLAGSKWANVGESYLFKTFAIRPDRDDFKNFEFIAGKPILSSVRCIRLELGTLSINYALENLGFAYLEEHNEIRALQPAGIPYKKSAASFESKSTVELDRKKKEAMEEYAAWNVRWHESQQDFTKIEALYKLFEKVKTLDRIEMAYKACPFQNHLLMNSWIQGTHNYTFNRKLKEFYAVSTSIKLAGSSIKHFSHDSLPWIVFTLDSAKVLKLFKPLENLESTRLTFDSTQTPTAKFWAGLGTVLKSMPKLTDIHFGFAPFQSGFADSGTWQDSENAAEWYVPLQNMFGYYTWNSLQKLRLDGLVVCETGLTSFLERHPALQSLELYNIALWQGTFQGLLTTIAEMQLCKFRMWGVFSAFHSLEESWRINPGYDTDVEGWSTVFKNFIRQHAAEDMKLWKADGNISMDDVQRGLEGFALQNMNWYGLNPWPLTPGNGVKADGIEHLGSKRSHNRYCSSVPHSDWPGCLPLSPGEMEAKWELLIARPNLTSGDFEAPDLLGVGEPEFANLYSPQVPNYAVMPVTNPIPVDIFGFDAKGNIGNWMMLRERGYMPKERVGSLKDMAMHYSKLQDEWTTRPDHVSAMAAYRGMLDGVLGEIPRYQLRSRQTGVAKDLLNVTPSNRQIRIRKLVMGLTEL